MSIERLKRFISFVSNFSLFANEKRRAVIGRNVGLAPVYKLTDVKIGNFTYISFNSRISFTDIGKFCSIGPNFICGYGIHPTHGISTSPVFYSTNTKLTGFTFSRQCKLKEREKITIGNDVFIGANVTVLDGVTIGHGAVIGAGAVVSKDIPPYSIAVGCPIKIIKYRFDQHTIDRLLEIAWWDQSEAVHQSVEAHFFNVQKFIEEYTSQTPTEISKSTIEAG